MNGETPSAAMPQKSRPSRTHAVVGILRREDGAVFMQQRRAPQTFDGFWEFPGGKVNPGEELYAALQRELREETGIFVRRAHRFVRRRRRHPGGELLLDFFHITEYDGAPRGREGQNCLWAAADALPSPPLPANESVCKWLRLPPICAITAAEIFGADETLRRLQNALREKRFRFVQLRDKNLPPQQRRSFARRAAELCRAHGALFCINDDEFLAAETGGGLHLGSRRLAECRARPPFEWTGASCHSAEEIARAAALGLDFAVLSPVCKTLSHVAAPPLGWRRFAEIAATAGIPIYALGGL
ncbi:MAG: Nudix family hydrolase, partial [Gammaproteobacteria bacterium]